MDYTAALNIIKTFEGCRLMSYQDVVGIWTIGWGKSGPDIKQNMVITQVQADEFLEADLISFADRVQSIVHSSLNLNQVQAAICFAYNVRGWAATPLFGFLVRGDVESAQQHWLLYDKVTSAGQKIEVQGLKNRRQAELNLFCKPEEIN